MNILFLGTGSFATPALTKLLAGRHTVSAVITQPDRKSGRGLKLSQGIIKKLALEHSLPLLQLDDINTTEGMRFITSLKCDLAVTAAFGQIISERVLSLPKYGFINIHASLLPKYRGAAPVVHTILNQEKVTGVTIFHIVRKLDAGPILAVRMMEIPDRATAGSLEAALSELGAELLTTVIDNIESGRAVEIPQDNCSASYAPKIDRGICNILWNNPAKKIDAQVRALNTRPLARTSLKIGEKTISLNIIETDIPNAKCGMARPVSACSNGGNVECGTILSTANGVITLSCGSDAIDVKMLQPENKRILTAQEFINGYRVNMGDRFC